ncbi:MAG TPA: aminopeptidase P N-terminal domain-containing protein, partial [Candidatus Saccharimonadales bacterium]|nr:aminopeptidase P N-terminal domain-containing protein [Candidatus Saccharimonadales bacterium]
MNSKFFAGNRSKLLNQVNSAPIVLSANGLIQRTRDDEVFPFEQDGNFWYLTGVDEPDVLLVMDGSKEYLVLPKRDDRHKVFSEQVDKAKLKNTSGISEIYDYDEGWEKLAAILKKSKSFHTVKPPEE